MLVSASQAQVYVGALSHVQLGCEPMFLKLYLQYQLWYVANGW